jgi:hypothetical protein
MKENEGAHEPKEVKEEDEQLPPRRSTIPSIPNA